MRDIPGPIIDTERDSDEVAVDETNLDEFTPMEADAVADAFLGDDATSTEGDEA